MVFLLFGELFMLCCLIRFFELGFLVLIASYIRLI